MKNLKYILLLFLLPVLLYSCTDKKNMNNPNQNGIKENKYPSSEEAVQNGKNDLLTLLKNKDLNINIDAAALEKSTPEKAVPVFEVNFDRLLKSEGDSLTAISTDSKKLSTPLVNDNKVVAVISTSQNDKGWQLNEITNPELSSDLNEIRTTVNQMNIPVSVYEVPNINATLYEVNMQGRKMYFTKYDSHSLREAIAGDAIMKQIRSDAQIFQRKFGEQLKKEKLMK